MILESLRSFSNVGAGLGARGRPQFEIGSPNVSSSSPRIIG
jgi:hypothetical protein